MVRNEVFLKRNAPPSSLQTNAIRFDTKDYFSIFSGKINTFFTNIKNNFPDSTAAAQGQRKRQREGVQDPVPDPAEERHEVRVGCANGKDQRAFQVFNTSGLRKKKHHPCLLLIQLDPGHPGKDSTLSEKATYPGVLYNLRPSFVIRPGLSFREEKTLSRHPEQRVFCRMVFTV